MKECGVFVVSGVRGGSFGIDRAGGRGGKASGLGAVFIRDGSGIDRTSASDGGSSLVFGGGRQRKKTSDGRETGDGGRPLAGRASLGPKRKGSIGGGGGGGGGGMSSSLKLLGAGKFRVEGNRQGKNAAVAQQRLPLCLSAQGPIEIRVTESLRRDALCFVVDLYVRGGGNACPGRGP
jgi:hypothetical protein